jgi:hypothetical protein
VAKEKNDDSEAKDAGSVTVRVVVNACGGRENWVQAWVDKSKFEANSEVEITVRRIGVPKETETDWQRQHSEVNALLSDEREAHAVTQRKLAAEREAHKKTKAELELSNKRIRNMLVTADRIHSLSLDIAAEAMEAEPHD